MDEETLRQMAITRYLQGKKPISIYRDLGKTKKWSCNLAIPILAEELEGRGKSKNRLEKGGKENEAER